MFVTPLCHKCKSNRCLVIYRRNGGDHVWVCAVCAGWKSNRGQ